MKKLLFLFPIFCFAMQKDDMDDDIIDFPTMIQSGNPYLMRIWLKYSTDIPEINIPDNEGNTILHRFCAHSPINWHLTKFGDNGPLVIEGGITDRTVYETIFALLLSKSPKLSLNHCGNSALSFATYHGNYIALRYLFLYADQHLDHLLSLKNKEGETILRIVTRRLKDFQQRASWANATSLKWAERGQDAAMHVANYEKSLEIINRYYAIKNLHHDLQHMRAFNYFCLLPRELVTKVATLFAIQE